MLYYFIHCYVDNCIEKCFSGIYLLFKIEVINRVNHLLQSVHSCEMINIKRNCFTLKEVSNLEESVVGGKGIQ